MLLHLKGYTRRWPNVTWQMYTLSFKKILPLILHAHIAPLFYLFFIYFITVYCCVVWSNGWPALMGSAPPPLSLCQRGYVFFCIYSFAFDVVKFSAWWFGVAGQRCFCLCLSVNRRARKIVDEFFLPIFNRLDVWRTKDRLDFAGNPGSRYRCGNYYGNFFYRCGTIVQLYEFRRQLKKLSTISYELRIFWGRIRIEEFLTEYYHCGTGPILKIWPDHLMPIGWCFRSPNVSTFSQKFLRDIQTSARNIRFRCYLAFDRKTSAHIPHRRKSRPLFSICQKKQATDMVTRQPW